MGQTPLVIEQIPVLDSGRPRLQEARATVGDDPHFAKPLRGTAGAMLSIEPLP